MCQFQPGRRFCLLSAHPISRSCDRLKAGSIQSHFQVSVPIHHIQRHVNTVSDCIGHTAVCSCTDIRLFNCQITFVGWSWHLSHTFINVQEMFPVVVHARFKPRKISKTLGRRAKHTCNTSLKRAFRDLSLLQDAAFCQQKRTFQRPLPHHFFCWKTCFGHPFTHWENSPARLSQLLRVPMRQFCQKRFSPHNVTECNRAQTDHTKLQLGTFRRWASKQQPSIILSRRT